MSLGAGADDSSPTRQDTSREKILRWIPSPIVQYLHRTGNPWQSPRCSVACPTTPCYPRNHMTCDTLKIVDCCGMGLGEIVYCLAVHHPGQKALAHGDLEHWTLGKPSRFGVLTLRPT